MSLLKKYGCFFLLCLLATMAQAQFVGKKFFHRWAQHQFIKLVTDEAGDHYISGIVQSPVSSWSDGGNALLIKLDRHTLDTLWTREWSCPLNMRDELLCSVPNGKNGIYIAGQTLSPLTASHTCHTGWLACIDPNGHMLWQKTYGGPGKATRFITIAIAKNNDLLIGGQLDSMGIYYSLLMRTDPMGNVLWARNYRAAGTQHGTEFVFENVDGTIDQFCVQDISAYSYGITFLHCNASGHIISKKLLAQGGHSFYLSSVKKVPGGYLVSGAHTDDFNFSIPFLMKTDGDANVIWFRQYSITGTHNWNSFASILPEGDHIMMSGTLMSDSVFTKSYGLLARLDSMGMPQWARCYDTRNVSPGNISPVPTGYLMGGMEFHYPAFGSDIFLLATDTAGKTDCYLTDIEIQAHDSMPAFTFTSLNMANSLMNNYDELVPKKTDYFFSYDCWKKAPAEETGQDDSEGEAWIGFPNIFTPNGTGPNDVWHVNGNLNEGVVTIYNRWGQQVFFSNLYPFNWPGTTQDQTPLANGVYYYIWRNNDGSASRTGFIHLTR